MKKASANMWWIIIGAVIALVVVIILMVIFSDTTTDLEKGLSSCEGKGGVCVLASGLGCPGNTFSSSAFGCNNNAVCCIGLPKKCTDETDCGKNEKCENYGENKNYCLEKWNSIKEEQPKEPISPRW